MAQAGPPEEPLPGGNDEESSPLFKSDDFRIVSAAWGWRSRAWGVGRCRAEGGGREGLSWGQYWGPLPARQRSLAPGQQQGLQQGRPGVGPPRAGREEGSRAFDAAAGAAAARARAAAAAPPPTPPPAAPRAPPLRSGA